MTTNSPNPVDGDVQALIAECKVEIDSLKWKIERTRKSGGALVYLESCLKRQQIALATLTAERCGSLIQAVNPKTGSVNIFYRSRGIDSIDPEEIAEWEMQEVEHLYTTPPAHTLRPVELPGCVDDLHGIGPVMSADAVIEALRQQGYEVKND